MREPWLDDNTERIPIPQAAGRFGVSTSTINRWIREQHLKAMRVDGIWYVLIRRDNRGEQESTHQHKTGQTSHAAGQDAIVTISNLRAEIQFLRSELANRTEELRRKDYIIAALITDNPPNAQQEQPEDRRRERETAWHQYGPAFDALYPGESRG